MMEELPTRTCNGPLYSGHDEYVFYFTPISDPIQGIRGAGGSWALPPCRMANYGHSNVLQVGKSKGPQSILLFLVLSFLHYPVHWRYVLHLHI